MWASMAPFGGNTVGAQTAAWRYFQRDLSQLSLSEYASLAVLPNAPSEVHLSKNVDLLKERRNLLLDKLHKKGLIDSLDLMLAKDEEVPTSQLDLPQHSLQLLELCKKQFPNDFFYQSTIDLSLQESAQSTVDEFSKLYQFDDINHAAALIIDNKSNQVLAYIANSNSSSHRYVDCIQAPRSYGSLLKPFLYAHALDKGYFLPNEKIKDIPTSVGGYTPKNYDRTFRGLVPFYEMVSQSLNVPAVRILNYCGLKSFHKVLHKELNLKYINEDAEYHGLSIILGGAEATLWEMARLYKGLAQNHNGEDNPYKEATFLMDQSQSKGPKFEFDPLAVHQTITAMSALERPKEEQHYIKYGGTKIAWKTGTSYGHRDAWAIGVTPEYTVAVWVGNENGHGVYDLMGASKAAPILFRILGKLDGKTEFKAIQPKESVSYCVESGQLRGPLCTQVKTIGTGRHQHAYRQCNSHQPDGSYKMDAVASFYHKKFYGSEVNSTLTPSDKDLVASEMKIVYPSDDAIVFLPKKLDGNISQFTISANTNSHEKVFWYHNNVYLTSTLNQHDLSLDLGIGPHELYVINESGAEDHITFEVVKSK